jgi:biopolymer transport protein ExbD
MARGRKDISVEQELNLAPIMNMVVILIPLLLLSVVFLKVGVINITAPKLSMGPPSDTPPPEEEPLNLTVAVSAKGFRLAATGAVLPEQPGCPVPGPTICLEEQSVDVAAKYDKARKLISGGQVPQGEAELSAAMSAYNWKELYNQLVRIKNKYKDETIVNISADPDVPYAVIVRVMDVARFKLEKDSYSKASDFWASSYKKEGQGYAELFPDPVLSVAQ